MRTKMRLAWGLAIAAGVALSGMAASSWAQPGSSPNSTKPADPTDKPDLSKLEKRDLVIFNSGRQVEGVILSETDTSITMLVIGGGNLRSTTTYSKSEILEIKKNEFKPPAETKAP